jgi:phenolic acid decarboxylase
MDEDNERSAKAFLNLLASWNNINIALITVRRHLKKLEWTYGKVVLSICGNSFKTVGKIFLIKLVERMPSVKSCNQGKVATLKNLKYKIYFDLFNTFLVTT